MSITTYDFDVLIIGGGPVGLALATELTAREHTACVVEQNDRVGVQPRAKTTNVRTMSHMRRWGLAPEMRLQSPLQDDFPRRVRFATSLFGHDIFNFENAFCAEPKRDDRFPEHAEFIPQYVVEGILLEHVKAEPLATVVLQTRLENFRQLPEGGVSASVKDLKTGENRTITARFMVGADGGRSTVRQQLGIEMQGLHSLISFVTLILRIPGLNDDPDLKKALFHWLVSPTAPCIMGPMDKEDVWFWAMPVSLDKEVPDSELLDLVRAAVRKEFDFEVLARDPWTVHKILAERYAVDDIFLVGDACHLHSPFGGHGMNQGVSDAVDLGWKLSAVLKGWGHRALLDSYETERKPAHQLVLDTSTENVASLSDHFLAPALDEDSSAGEEQRMQAAKAVEEVKTPEFRSLGVVLGYRYVLPQVGEEPGNKPPEFSVTEYTPSAYPGSLAPHAWLEDDSSLYDHFGKGFTLLRLGDADESAENALCTVAAKLGMPLTVFAPGLESLSALYGARYAFIRPDQHVAWRGDTIEQPHTLLDRVRGVPTLTEDQADTSKITD